MFPVSIPNDARLVNILNRRLQDNVGRIVIDGVVDSENYYAGKHLRIVNAMNV